MLQEAKRTYKTSSSYATTNGYQSGRGLKEKRINSLCWGMSRNCTKLMDKRVIIVKLTDDIISSLVDEQRNVRGF